MASLKKRKCSKATNIQESLADPQMHRNNFMDINILYKYFYLIIMKIHFLAFSYCFHFCHALLEMTLTNMQTDR
jgi:hypothetical protein